MEISELILDTEYDAILVGGGVDTNTLLVLRMIRELSKHIHYDEDYYGYILSTTNLWEIKYLNMQQRLFIPTYQMSLKKNTE